MPRSTRITLRTAEAAEAGALHALISANLVEGHLLPRTLDELAVHATRFVVALRGRTIVGCAELAPLSPQVAEIRSLAVDRSARRQSVGTCGAIRPPQARLLASR
jgi:amino-acid N-acetyltransferase